MDQRQKNLLNSATRELADTIDFEQISELLALANIVSQEQLAEIKASVVDPFCRNLKLLNALQESDSSNAFDEFVQILEITQNARALALVCPTSANRKRADGSRGILNKLAVKFGKFRSASQQYPLGLKSGSFNSGRLASVLGARADSSYVNPLKEKQQATLVSSSNCSPTNIDGASQVKAVDVSRVISSLDPQPSASKSAPKNVAAQLDTSPYTPARARPNELRIQDLRLNDADESDDQQVASAREEPLVYWHPYAQSQSGESSPHHCLHSCASSYDSDSSSDSAPHIDSTLILESDVTLAIAKEEANTMFVQRATVLHNNADEDYKMTAKPRGFCLIVNNIDFDGDIFPTRTGSDVDAKRFDEVFTQLSFTIVMRRNLTAEQMKDTFREVASKCQEQHDALFVFILSHGCENGIFGVDGIEVSIDNDIISCFDNRNCKTMREKPKIFVIQACRGSSIDYGGGGDMTDSIGISPVARSSPILRETARQNRVPTSWLPSSHAQDGRKQELPTRTDMLVVFSCLAGYVSVRNETRGSWLGVALSYFIMKHAHEKDFLKILNFVTDDITQRMSDSGHVQSTEVKLLGWKKNLYFNPGL